MDKNELIRRIDGISYERIPDMDEFSVKMLTDDFKEPLVRRLISKAPASNQKWALEWIERKYRDCNTWNPTPPSYFQTLRFDIDCGIPITSNDDASTVTHVIQSGETKVNVVVQSQTKDQQTLIAKLRKENAELKAKLAQKPVATNGDENEELKNIKQLLVEKEQMIQEQQRLIEDYSARFDPRDLRKKKFLAMTGKQHIILILAVLAHNDRLPNSRRSMSLLMSFIASRNESTMEDYLGDAISNEECETLARVFDNEKQPFLASIIRQLPDKLERDKLEKNRTKALKKHNE